MRRFPGKRSCGAASVEAAIVLPLILLLTFGFIEVGWWVYRSHIVHNAARQGARAAVRLENSNSEVSAAVLAALTNSISVSSDGVTVRISKLNSAGVEEYQVMNLDENELGAPIRVTVTVEYVKIGTLSNMMGLASRNLVASAAMKRRD